MNDDVIVERCEVGRAMQSCTACGAANAGRKPKGKEGEKKGIAHRADLREIVLIIRIAFC